MSNQKWDIQSVNKRLENKRNSADVNIARFESKLYEAISSSAIKYGESLPDELIKNMLSYSYHQQVIDNYSKADLGIFSNFLNNPCSMQDIYKFEKEAMQKCNLSNYEMPSYLRISLMISNTFEFPFGLFPKSVDDWTHNIESGCTISPFQKWAFKDYKCLEYLETQQFEYCDSAKERVHDFISKAKESGKECIVFLYDGHEIYDCKIMWEWAWNILTNEILYNELHIEESWNRASRLHKSFEKILPQRIPWWICDFDAPLVDRFDEYELFEDVGSIGSYLVQEGHMIQCDKGFPIYEYYVSEMYSEKYKPLINGWIRLETNGLSLPKIPICVNQLILTYFPMFVEWDCM